MLGKLSHFNTACFTKRDSLSPLGQRIVEIGQNAALQAIARHKALGNPIYYKEKDRLIKELADGTRYLVKASIDGIQTIRKL